jgi:hypothetical protein
MVASVISSYDGILLLSSFEDVYSDGRWVAEEGGRFVVRCLVIG